MKKSTSCSLLLMTILCLILSIVSCKKNSSNDPVVGEPIKSSKGEPLGTAVQQQIGAAGGTLTSGDGTLTIKVPPGAVAANTQFGIQPITNTLYNDVSKTAFRLTPEGTTFSKPVEVTYQFSAEQMKNTLPEVITAAYQTSEGNWKAVTGHMNKDTRLYTFKTTHFSDWTINGSIYLQVSKKFVSFGETSSIQVMAITPSPKDDLLAPLTFVNNIQFSLIQRTKGTLTVDKNDPTKGQFTPNRPQPNQSNIAEIAAKLSGHFRTNDESLPGGSASFHELTVLTSIEILNDTYMKGTFMGAPIEITNVVATASEVGLGVTGQMNGITIGFATNGLRPIRYPCGEITESGKALITVTSTSGPIPKNYSSAYAECDANNVVVPKHSKGSVTIEKWGNVGEIVEGSIIGPVYIQENTPGNCPRYKSHQIDVQFRTVRTL